MNKQKLVAKLSAWSAQIKSSLQKITRQLVRKPSIPTDRIKAFANTFRENFDRKNITEWIQKRREMGLSGNLESFALTAQKTSELFRNKEELRKFIQRYGTTITVVSCAYLVSDLATLLVRKMIPEPPAIRMRMGAVTQQTQQQDFDAIVSRNLFNSEGKIPGEDQNDPTGAPVRTSLPLNLLGSVIVDNPIYSIATIEDKTERKVYPVQVGDEIPGKLKVTQVEAFKVTFLNLSSRRNEFIDLPEDFKGPKTIITSSKSSATQGVEKLSGTRFAVSRAKVDNALSPENFSKILTQARAIPDMQNGVAGFRLSQIQKGSIYDELGLKDGDFLTCVNGQDLKDPSKAMTLVSELKDSDHLELCVSRGGANQNFVYDIN